MEDRKEKQVMARQVLGVFGLRVLQLGMSLAASIFIARSLGPEGKGVLNLVFAFISVSGFLFSFGLSNSLVYFGGSGRYPQGRLFSLGMFWTLVIVLAYFPGAAAFYWLSKSSVLKGVHAWYFFAVLPLFPLFMLNLVSGSLAKASGKITGAALVVFAKEALFFALLSFSLLAAAKGAGWIIAAKIFSDLAGLAAMMRLIWGQIVIRDLLPSLDAPASREIFAYGGKSYVGSITQPANNRADVFIVNFFMNPAAVGVYTVGLALAEAMLLLPSVINFVLFPKVSSAGREAGAKYTASFTRRTFWLMAFSGALLCPLAGPLIRLLYGADFAAARYAVYLIFPGTVMFAVSALAGAFFEGTGRPEIMMKANIMTFLINIVLNLALIPAFGFAGAAAALGAAYFAQGIFVTRLFVRETRIPFSVLFAFRPGDFSLKSILEEAGF